MPQIPPDVVPIDVESRTALLAEVVKELFGPAAVASGTGTNIEAAQVTTINALGDDAFMEVTNLAKWYLLTDSNYTGPTGTTGNTFANNPEEFLPIQFNELFKLSWIAKGLRHFRSAQMANQFSQQHVGPAVERAITYFDPDFAKTGDPLGDPVGAPFIDAMFTWTVNTMLRSVISVLARQRTPVIPPFIEGARTLASEYVKLWKGRRWSFRIRHKKMTISALGNLIADDPDEFNGLASKHLIVKGSGDARYEIFWLDSERFARAAPYYDGRTGRPRFFYDEDHGDAQVTTFLPAPDKAYTVWGNIIIGPPPLGTSNNDVDGGIMRLPNAFRYHLRDRIIAELASQWGREDQDAKRLMVKADKDLKELSGQWQERGASRYTARGHHQLKYASGFLSYRGNGVIGQMD